MDQGYRKFLTLWIGAFISAIGSGLSSFGLGVYVFKITGLASATAMVMLAGFLPGLLLSPLSGALSDRFDRRLLMILGDALSAIGIFIIIISMILGHSGIWLILFGISISSIFSSLVEPAFKATVSDLLDKELFSKASGMMQIINSSKFLISPLLAGFLLTLADIKLLLILDILTILPMVVLTQLVRKDIPFKKNKQSTTMVQEIQSGYRVLRGNKGVWKLVLLGSQISVFLGILQTLITPFVLSFSDEKFLGFATSLSAVGILVSSGVLGVVAIKKGYHNILSFSLFMAGLFMVGFAVRENTYSICIFGFLFFAMLPFANMSMDYLVRTNLKEDVQGRAWGLIGLISQLGYVLSYVLIAP